MKKGVAPFLLALFLAAAAAAAFSLSHESTEESKGATMAARSTLTMKPWTWVSTKFNDGKVIKAKSAKFTLTFNKDGRFASTTDCNTLGGQYSTEDRKITVSQIVSTQMYCDNSQEKEYIKGLPAMESYFFRTTGELVFDFEYGGGFSIFR